MPSPKKPTKSPAAEPSSSPPAKPAAKRAAAAARGSSTGETHQRFPTTSATDPKIIRDFAIDAARMLADDKCSDIVLLDVTAVSNMSDYIIVASGTSDRQMMSSGDDVAKLGEARNYRPFRSDADQRSTWIIVDFVDIVVHIFEPNTRAHYDLEMLWADATRVEWERADQKNRNRAGLA